MRDPTIARNYAEALLAAAQAADERELYGELIEAIGGALEAEPRLKLVLELPRIRKAQKLELISRALGDIAPLPFIRFLQAVIHRGRQGLLPGIALQYRELLDRQLNRVHAGVVLAREPDPELVSEVGRRLTELLGQEVVPHVRVEPRLLGGVVIRVGERIYDGSLRRRLRALRRAMLVG